MHPSTSTSYSFFTIKPINGSTEGADASMGRGDVYPYLIYEHFLS